MRITFIGPLRSTFVKNEVEILEAEHELLKFDAEIGTGINGLGPLFGLTMRSLRAVIRSKVIFCWFADYATLLPALLARLLGKSVYVVAGGDDSRWLPHLNYGAKAKPERWFFIRNTFRFASRIFAVSQASAISLDVLTKGRHGPIEVLHNGVNISRIQKLIDGKSPVRDIVLTVSQASIPLEMHIKGIDRVVKLSEQMPDQEFLIAGLRGAALELIQWAVKPLKNIIVLPGPLDFESELIPLYHRATAYCQLSVDETFGVAVVEAMACGCVPVVTNVGGLPEVVGECAEPADTDAEIIERIREAANVQDRSSFQLQAQRFDISRRAAVLLKLLR